MTLASVGRYPPPGEHIGDGWRFTPEGRMARRPVARRLDRMRANLNRVPLGPPPLYAASTVLDHPPNDADDEARMRRWIDGYAAALRRRGLDGTVDVRLVSGDLLDRRLVLIAERRPPRENT